MKLSAILSEKCNRWTAVAPEEKNDAVTAEDNTTSVVEETKNTDQASNKTSVVEETKASNGAIEDAIADAQAEAELAKLANEGIFQFGELDEDGDKIIDDEVAIVQNKTEENKTEENKTFSENKSIDEKKNRRKMIASTRRRQPWRSA